MSSSDLIRWGWLAAFGAGVLFIVLTLLAFAVGKGDEASPLDLLAILAYALEVVGLVGFHALQGRNYGRIGRAGLYTAIGGIVVWALVILASLFGESVSLGLLAAVGALGMLVGFVLYGAATLQARVLPRWCGILFIVFIPVGILLAFSLTSLGTALWEGLVWLGLGYALWSQSSGAAAGQPARVR